MKAALRRIGRKQVLAVVCALAVVASAATIVEAATSAKSGIMVATSVAEAASATRLSQQTVSGQIYVFTRNASNDIANVRYYLDNASGVGEPSAGVDTAPFAVAGDQLMDTTQLADGIHTLLAEATLSSGAVVDFFARFEVANGAAVAPTTNL